MEKYNKLNTETLRQKAEEKQKKKRSLSSSILSEAEALKLILELEVHQIELEMQNEELMDAKNQLERVSDKYIELYDFAPLGYFTLSKEGKIIELNFSGARMLGKSRSIIRNSSFSLFVSPDTKSNFNLFLENAFKSIGKETCEVKLSINGNSSLNAHLSGIVSENGERCLLTVLDISDRKQAEESLIASETRYCSLFESANEGILLLDAETGKIIDVNPYLMQLFSCSEDQFLGKGIWEIEFLKDKVLNHHQFLELQKREYFHSEELPLESSDGRKFNVEYHIHVYYVSQKKVIQYNIRDINNRRQSELALRNSETHLRTLVQAIPDLIWLKDINGVYLSCNPIFGRFFGANEAEIIGKTDYDFVDKELADFFRENDQKAMTAGKPTINEEWISFADDGHRVFLETIKTPMYDSLGTLLGVLGIGRDITERKHAAQVVIASEKRFRAIFDQAPIAIALVDLKGYPIISNLTLSNMLGYTSEELAKMNFTEFTYREDIDRDNNLFTDLINGKISWYRMEKRYVHKNGKLIWGNLFVTTLSDQNGLSHEVMGMIEDITERKSVEITLKESEEKLRSYIVNAPEGVLVVDQTGRFIEVNDSACMMSGYSMDEHFHMSITDVLSDESLVEGMLQFNKLLLGERLKADLLIRCKNGLKRWVALEAVKLSETRYLGFVKDITERKLAEEEIIMLSQSLKSINECVSITDLENNILFVNESFLKTYGYELNELVGKNITIVRSQREENSRVNEILPATIEGDWQGELLQKRKDGSEFPIYLSTTNIKDLQNNILGLIGVATDISERKRAEKELIEAKEQAEESDRLKSAFLANMSHEVRTPLNSIIGFSELLEDPDFKPEQKSDFIHQIITSGNNLLTIISDIMDISKLESGEIIIHKSQMNAHKFVSSVKEQFSFQAAAKKLELKLCLPDMDEGTSIITDAGRLHQIFNNLMNNALKFTVKGSIEIGLTPYDKLVEFYVRDTGIGIPTQYHDKIFDRFRQVEDAKTRSYGGNGLGLAITKNLVELMGGKIWVESEPGKGSSFYFTLPC
jgi:PAS domain S-box-containing protein